MFVLGLATAHAAGIADIHIQDLDSVRSAVESFVAAQTGDTRGERSISVGNLDTRLRLRACGDRLEVFFPPGSRTGRNRTVGVDCSGPKPWTIYVSVTIRYRGEVLVAARALPRGAVIGHADVVVEERELDDGAFGYLADPDGALGRRTTRPLRAGSPIPEGALEDVPTVLRGQSVWIIAQSPYLMVRMVGTALQDGAPGDRIQVENPRSKKVVEGVVDEEGVVRIRL
jgi:flagella basal body P-ring formation protein FlgA